MSARSMIIVLALDTSHVRSIARVADTRQLGSCVWVQPLASCRKDKGEVVRIERTDGVDGARGSGS